MTDFRDLVIQDLAQALHHVERERESYRELLILTLEQLGIALRAAERVRATRQALRQDAA